MKLNKEIAQKIVERANKIINYSINVMDQEGDIIASSDISRVGQRHSGAVIALRENKAIEVDAQLEKSWYFTVKQGINLPFSYMGSNIGVIGISGDPNSVRQYAELVKITAEFIIEQAILLDRERWNYRYKEEFISQLITKDNNLPDLEKHAKFFDIDLSTPLIAVIIHLNNPTLDLLQNLMNYWMIDIHDKLRPLIAVTAFNEIVILHPYLATNKDEHYLKLLPPSINIKHFKIVVGGYFDNVENLYLSYQTAQETLKYINKMYPKKNIAHYQDYRLPVLLNTSLQGWKADELLCFYKKLQISDPKKIYQKTLKSYFLNNCDLIHTSNKLHIHLNTLRYRLDKIEQITGLSINNFDEKMMLYFGVVISEKL